MARNDTHYDEEYFEGRGSFFYRISGGYRNYGLYFAQLARWFRPYLGSGPILDAGCAYGYLLARFNSGLPRHGCDLSEWALAKARTVTPDVHLARADLGGGLPYADSTFTAVLCTDTLEHVSAAGQGRALREARRVLARGGHLCLTTPNRAWIRRLLYKTADRTERHVGMAHVNRWEERLAGHGFEVLDSWTYLHGLLPGRTRRVRWLPECGMLARKPA